MIEREDGPVKHYRMKCDKCGKQTKRFAYEFYFEHDSPPGWKEIDSKGDGWDCKHHCPKCVSGIHENIKEEIVPNIGDCFDISDHDAVCRPLTRKAVNTLVIDLQDGCKLVITSDTLIKVEQHDE